MSGRPRALLLDLDGTLVDSLPALTAVWRAFLLARGKQGTDEQFSHYVGPPLDRVVARLKDEFALDEPTDTLLTDYQQRVAFAYTNHVELAPGAKEILGWAAANAWRIAVVTSAPRALASPLLQRLGISALLVAGDDVTQGKPAPAPYREACRGLQVSPADAVAVEDSPSGVQSAIAAGVRCIALVQARSAPALRQHGAWLVVPGLAEAVAELARYSAGMPRWTDAASLQVSVLGPPTRTSALQSRIDQCWQEARRERPDLHDGGIYTLGDGSASDGQARLALWQDHYRAVLAQRRGVEMGLWSLAVTGLITWRDHLLVGRRSSNVTQYPGAWAAVPSGGFEPAAGIDPIHQLYAELAEEVGLSASAVHAPELLGLSEDLVDRVIDIVYRLRVPDETAPAELRWSRSHEHVEIELVPGHELSRLEPRVPGLLELAGYALQRPAGG